MSRSIAALSPAMQRYFHSFIKQCKAESLDVILICTDRNQTDQEAAFNAGFSKARYGQSAHNAILANGKPASEAFDIGVVQNGKYIGDSNHPHYQRAGVIGEKLGLKWYGNARARFREAAHFQNPFWVRPK